MRYALSVMSVNEMTINRCAPKLENLKTSSQKSAQTGRSGFNKTKRKEKRGHKELSN